MDTDLDHLVSLAPDPAAAGLRLQRLQEDTELWRLASMLPSDLFGDFITVISISRFLFHFICRHPQSINLLGEQSYATDDRAALLTTMDQLRIFKYQELLKICWMDISGRYEYREILNALSCLAETVVRRVLSLSRGEREYNIVAESLCTMALGKLGANELNFSSDIDLIFVCANPGKDENANHALQKLLFDSIREMNRLLEENTAEGFLYRVDLRLRPWGSSGPLVMPLDDTEHYYEASAEPWERFAWLRARVIAGSRALAGELLERLQPYIFMRSLSTDDLSRFIEIKQDMGKARRKPGKWNVKVGQGGIRDIEFFLQILQLVNAAHNRQLQTTSTLDGLAGLCKSGLINAVEEQEIYHSYIFLRRLENRLQMFGEQQVHDLPDDPATRLILARSLYRGGTSNDEVMNSFESDLIASKAIASKYFDRVLPGEKA